MNLTSQLNHEAEFERAWADPGNTQIELPALDVNRVLGDEIDVTGAEHPHRKNFYFRDPVGSQFEFMQYLSDVPEEKNLYGGETSNVSRPKKSS